MELEEAKQKYRGIQDELKKVLTGATEAQNYNAAAKLDNLRLDMDVDLDCETLHGFTVGVQDTLAMSYVRQRRNYSNECGAFNTLIDVLLKEIQA